MAVSCCQVPPHVACGLLYLVANVGSKARAIVEFLMKNEEEKEQEEDDNNDDDDEAKSSKSVIAPPIVIAASPNVVVNFDVP